MRLTAAGLLRSAAADPLAGEHEVAAIDEGGVAASVAMDLIPLAITSAEQVAAAAPVELVPSLAAP
jgi:hypothetical protein